MSKAKESTPQAQGSAMIGKQIGAEVGVRQEDVHPWINHDIHMAKQVGFDDMLTTLLEDCGYKQQLTGALKMVLPFCNDIASAAGSETSNAGTIKKALMQYRTIPTEAKRYPEFVEATNAALCHFHDANAFPIKFQVQDPKVILQHHLKEKLQRKPDVVLVSSEQHSRISWRDVRTFVEFKTKHGQMAKLPPKYKADRLHDVEEYKQYLIGTHTTERAAGPSQPKQLKMDDDQHAKVAVQAGSYAAELFTAHVARQHVIGLIVIDDLLYLWRYDRQGPLQCRALNFIQDLPRFLVLLFVMQRFTNPNWGLNPHLDSEFGSQLKSQEVVLKAHCTKPYKVNAEEREDYGITLELSSTEAHTHYGLNGRATNIFPAKCEELGSSNGLVAKVIWGEKSRASEQNILTIIARNLDTPDHDDNIKDDIRGHIPELRYYRQFSDMSTAEIRRRLKLDCTGSRVLYIYVFRKLSPITDLSDNEFLKTWWDTVKCHLALWLKAGIHHQDVSPGNLMYYKENGNFIGVLNDFDLASIGDRSTGTEHTAMVPFMAQDLLTNKGLRGEITHLYKHDAESFIWTLMWISIRYSRGEYLENETLDEWLRVDAVGCSAKKSKFLLESSSLLDEFPAGEGHGTHLEIVQKYLRALGHSLLNADENLREPGTAFKALLLDPVKDYKQDGTFAYCPTRLQVEKSRS